MPSCLTGEERSRLPESVRRCFVSGVLVPGLLSVSVRVVERFVLFAGVSGFGSAANAAPEVRNADKANMPMIFMCDC